jgi:uncharacterized membrane protein HdeD (DUF308 family)
MTVTEPRKRGTGWIVFAGVVLVIAGANMFINGLWALHATTQQVNSFKNQLLFSDTNLDTWGWIYVIVGAVVLLAGIFVFMRSQWARWVGVLAAMVQAIFAFFWLFTAYWPSALIIIVIDMLVIYALSAYGDREYDYV